MTTTEQFLMYLEEKARHLRVEPWYWSYATWRYLRGFPSNNDSDNVEEEREQLFRVSGIE